MGSGQAAVTWSGGGGGGGGFRAEVGAGAAAPLCRLGTVRSKRNRHHGGSCHQPEGHRPGALAAHCLGVHGVALLVLHVGELQRLGGGRVGHRSEGLGGRRPHVSGGHHGDHSDRHHPLRSLLFPRPLRLQRVPLQCGDGHPQPAAQTRVLLLRVPDVPRAGGRVQRQLWFSLGITEQRSLSVHRPAGRVVQPTKPLQPGPGHHPTRSPHVLSAAGRQPRSLLSDFICSDGRRMCAKPHKSFW